MNYFYDYEIYTKRRERREAIKEYLGGLVVLALIFVFGILLMAIL